MATLSVQNITRAGVAPSYSAAAGGGDVMASGAFNFLHVVNAGVGSITVTITPPSNQNPIANVTYAALTMTVANGTNKMIGPLPPAFFGDAVTGTVAITYSGVTSVTVAALSLQNP